MITGKPLELQVITDDLTGLFNRRFLNEKLSAVIEESKTRGDYFALVMLDMDRFKEVNDNFGHDEGDKALLWIADILRNSVRSGDVVIRFAGDEFFLILPGSKIREALAVSERIYNNIRQNPFKGSRGQVTVPVGISGGIAIFPDDASSVESILKSADLGLYLAKEQGRGKICLASEARQKKQVKIERQLFLTPPFVGRNKELISLTKSWSEVQVSGKSMTTLIAGEQGMGKTRLVTEFLNKAEMKKALYFQATCRRYELEIPYQAIIDLLNQWMRIQKPLFEKHYLKLPLRERLELLKVLPNLEMEIHGEAIERLENDHSMLYYGMANLFKSVAAELPFVIVIDDLQWIDSASLDLLSHILIQTPDLPIFSVLVVQSSGTDKYRNPEIASLFRKIERETPTTEIMLPKLGPESFRDIVRKIFNPEKPRELFAIEEILCTESEGNPLFFRELLLKIIDEKILVYSNDGWGIDKGKTLTTPEKVKDFILERLEGLDTEKKGLLQKAGAIGREFFFDLLREISETNEGHLLDMMDALLSQGFIEEVPNARLETYRFTSIQIQKAVYEELSSVRKKRLHLRITELLENEYHKKKGDFIEMLFYHSRQARNLEKAFLYGIQSAMKAYKNHGLKEALHYFSEAFTVYNELIPELKELHAKLYLTGAFSYTDACILGGRYEEAMKFLKTLPEDPRKKDFLGLLHFRKGDYLESKRLYEEAFSGYEDPSLKSRAKSRLADLHYSKGDYETALKEARGALGLATQAGSLSMEALALKTMGNVSIAEGKFGAAFTYYRQAIKHFLKMDDRAETAGCLNNMGLCHYLRKRYRPALKSFFRAKKFCDETGSHSMAIRINNNIGNVYLDTDQLKLAEEYYRRSLNLAEDTGDVPLSIASYRNLGIIFEKSEPSKSTSYYEKGLDLCKKIGEKSREAAFYMALSDLAAGKKDYGAAEDLCQSALSIRKKLGELEEEAFAGMKLLEIFRQSGNAEKFEKGKQAVEKLLEKFTTPLVDRQAQLVKAFEEMKRTGL